MFETPEHNTAQVTELSTDELDLVAGGATGNKPKNSAPPSGLNNPIATLANDNRLVNAGLANEQIVAGGVIGQAEGIESALGLGLTF